MEQTRYLILKAHNPKQLEAELHIEEVLKEKLPGLDVDAMSPTLKHEFYNLFNQAPELLQKEDITKSVEDKDEFLKEFWSFLDESTAQGVTNEELKLVATMRQLLKNRGLI